MPPEQHVDREQIAFLMGVTVRTINNWIRNGDGFPSRLRGNVRDFPVRRCLDWQRARDIAKAKASVVPDPPSDVDDAVRRKAIADAQLAEIKVKKAQAEVVPVAAAAKRFRDTAGRIRGSLLAKPGEYASKILHLDTVADAVPKLRQLVDDVLSELQTLSGSGDDLALEGEESDQESPDDS